MMEAITSSKTSVNFYQTTCHNIPEDSHLHTRRRENLKTQQGTQTSHYDLQTAQRSTPPVFTNYMLTGGGAACVYCFIDNIHLTGIRHYNWKQFYHTSINRTTSFKHYSTIMGSA
jgi:hypothetical protein